MGEGGGQLGEILCKQFRLEVYIKGTGEGVKTLENMQAQFMYVSYTNLNLEMLFPFLVLLDAFEVFSRINYYDTSVLLVLV